jgi:hypothetical protein
MNKKYQQNALPTVIVSELEKLFASDKVVERKIKIYTGSLIISIILTIIGFILIPVIIIGIIALIISIVQLVRYRKQNIEDRKLLTGLKLAQILGIDLKKNSPLDISISFDNYLEHGKPLRGNKSLGKYLVTWLQAHGRLADSTVFDLKVHQKVSRKERRKRKYTKVKEVFNEIVSLNLRPISEDFPKLDQYPQALQKQRQQTINMGKKVYPLDIRRAVVRNGTIRLMATARPYMKVTGRGVQENGKENLVDGDTLLLFIIEAYAALRRCK